MATRRSKADIARVYNFINKRNGNQGPLFFYKFIYKVDIANNDVSIAGGEEDTIGITTINRPFTETQFIRALGTKQVYVSRSSSAFIYFMSLDVSKISSIIGLSNLLILPQFLEAVSLLKTYIANNPGSTI